MSSEKIGLIKFRGECESNVARIATYTIGLVCFLVTSIAQAGPASPFPVRIQQPNGNTFQAFARGDEFQNWMETAEGYTVVKNPATGAYEYAIGDALGYPVPSGVQVVPDGATVNVPPSQWPPKHLRPPRNDALEQYQTDFLNGARTKRLNGGASGTKANGPGVSLVSPVTGTWAPTPVTGSKKILMVLVNFLDASLQPGALTYWGDVVHSTSTQSVAKYYQDNSFGSISVVPVTSTQSGSPSGVVSVSLARNHPNCGSSCSYSTESGWINSALAAAAPHVNFAGLDTNSNGTIEVDEALIYFVLAGGEASSSGPAPSIWAHAWGGGGVSVAGKSVNHWALNGEMYSVSNRMTMGVVTHEMGHAMGGLPDLYDISGNNGGLGIFSLMSSGSWGRKSGEVGGATPVGLDGWSRQYLGWSTPQTPGNGAVVSFPSALSNPNASVMLMNSAASTSEYWLIENRPPVGWDAGMAAVFGIWSGGLLVQHIDSNIGSKSANSFNKYVGGSHQGNMAVEASNANCSLVTPSGSWGGCLSLMYYAGNNSAFTAGSAPSSNYYSGAASSLGMTNVSAPASTMTATMQTTLPSTYSLSVSRNGIGSVSSNPGGISCGATCSASFASGVSITLTATPDASTTFTGWGGACTGTASTCNVTMSVARSVVANFSVTCTSSVDTDGDGIPDCLEASSGTNPLIKDNDVFNNSTLFAKQQYRDFLFREGDAAGITGWSNAITAGTLTRAQLIDSFFSSTEFQSKLAPIVRLYFAYFLRIPDYGGLTYWLNEAKGGRSLNSTSDFFAASSEFTTRYGSLTNDQFVTLVYSNVLSRAADAGGKAYWVGQLNGGFKTRGQVMIGFSESAEYQAKMINPVKVTMGYVAMLRRSPDQASFDANVVTLDGGGSFSSFITNTLGSTEYRQRFMP
jgi:M6 family metalloprotease-like protein